MVCAYDLGALARLIAIDERAFHETLRRYNLMVRNGRDEDFDHGESAYDRFYGDVRPAHANLGAVEQPPFYAIRIHAGNVGTEAGACTDENGVSVIYMEGRLPDCGRRAM